MAHQSLDINDDSFQRPSRSPSIRHPLSLIFHPSRVTPTGFEPVSVSGDEGRTCTKKDSAGVADLYANQPDSTVIDPDLATVVRAWPGLPEATRAGIVAMVRAATGDAAGADL